MSKRKLTAYGYVGEWRDKTLGWFLPKFLHKSDTKKRPAHPYATFDSAIGRKGVLCKITIEEIPNRNKRKVKL